MCRTLAGRLPTSRLALVPRCKECRSVTLLRTLKQATILILLPFAAAARPNNPPVAISEYQKQEWHVEDGLSQSNVRAIIQAGSRELLLGNSEGITSFDGLHFAPWKVGSADGNANEPVNALLISRTGDLWIGTDDRGVIRQRGNSAVAVSENAGFHHERIRALFEDPAGPIWVATHNGIELITGDKIQYFEQLGLVPGDITQPFGQAADGRTFIVTAKGLFLGNSSGIEPFTLSHRELGNATAAYGDGSGVVWIGRSRGLTKLTPDGRGGYREQKLPAVHGPVTALISDHDANVWVGTKAHGVCRVSSDGTTSHWTTENGLSDDTIRTFLEDDEGNLWIGTLSGGLSRWRRSTLVPFGTPEGLPNSFAANVLADRRGDIWLGTWGSGLLRIRKGKLQQERLEGSPHTDPIRSLSEDPQGNIWIGTWFDGVYRYDGNSFQHFLTGRESPSNAISCIRVDSRGALWLGTYRGLLRYEAGIPEKGKGTLFLPETIITSFTEDRDGSLIVGTFKGLYRVRDAKVEAITEQDGLSNTFILSVSADSQGGIWVGTKGGGIDLIRGHQALHVPPAAGIPAYPVSSVLDDGHGMLWMSTTRGLLRVPLGQLQEFVAGSRRTVDSYLLGRNDGMRSSECGGTSQPPATRTRDGILWFATAKGFVHTDPTAENFRLPPLEARITGFQIERSDVPAAPAISLVPGIREFSLQFDAIRLSNPSQVQYRYKLEGYDPDWTTTSGHRAIYRHLAPGRYRFLASAHDAGQPWSAVVAETAVVQEPFFYQRTAFYFVTLLLAGGIVMALFRWRIARIKGRIRVVMEERNRISREWHDTLMASLAAISWQLESTRDRLDKNQMEAELSLEIARNMVRHSQTEARRIIWDLQDEAAPMGALSEVLSKVLDGMSTRSNLNAKLRVSGPEALLSPVAIHHLSCICQEAVANAARHGLARDIQVRLEYRDSCVTLSIKDNGCGFVTANGGIPGHFGLSVMEDRARKLGGDLKIASRPGAGCEVVVEVPVGAPA